MNNLPTLIEKLEKAERGSDELDRDLYLAFRDKLWPPDVKDGDPHWGLNDYTQDVKFAYIFASMVLPAEHDNSASSGWLFGTHRYRFKNMDGTYRWTGWVRAHARDAIEADKGDAPALALCIATLRALDEREG